MLILPTLKKKNPSLSATALLSRSTSLWNVRRDTGGVMRWVNFFGVSEFSKEDTE